MRPGPAKVTSGVRGDEEHKRECADDLVPFGLEWHEVGKGGRTYRVTVSRNLGLITHPWCREFSATGTCAHLERAIRLAEHPCEEVMRELLADWHDAYADQEDRDEWRAHAFQRMEWALERAADRDRWRAFYAEQTDPANQERLLEEALRTWG